MIKKYNDYIQNNVNENTSKETILSIEEWEGSIPYTWTDKEGVKHTDTEYGNSVAGYMVKTNKKEYKFAIQNSDNCCEQWGYFMSEDTFEDFIGAQLIDVKVVDTAMNVSELKMEDILKDGGLQEGDVMFININTSEGLLQFVAYNAHNGYYGHTAYLLINDTIQQEKSL